MKNRTALLIALLALTACKRPAQTAIDPLPVKKAIGDVPMIDFDSPEAHFSCLAPRNWGIRSQKYLEARKGSVFTGEDGRIMVYKYPDFEPQYTDAQTYAETFWQIAPNGKQPEIAKEKIGGTTVIRFHLERSSLIPHSKTLMPPTRYDYALFPIKGGFFEIQHAAPAATYQKTLPVFEAVVRSFKPKI